MTRLSGERYDFSYNFLTNEFGAGAANDFFVAGLFRAATGSTTVLAAASALGSKLVAAPAGSLAFMTAPANINFTVPAAGSYTVEVIVGVAVANASVPSFAVVSMVPEPARTSCWRWAAPCWPRACVDAAEVAFGPRGANFRRTAGANRLVNSAMGRT